MGNTGRVDVEYEEAVEGKPASCVRERALVRTRVRALARSRDTGL
jgi:hypothetical protein